MAQADNINPKELQIHVPDKIRAGVYANITNVTASKREVTFNFIYANPQDNPPGTMVSRVIVSRDHAEELMGVLKSTISTSKEVEGD
jgi:hypothetical protein